MTTRMPKSPTGRSSSGSSRRGRVGCPSSKRAAGAALECFEEGHPTLLFVLHAVEQRWKAGEPSGPHKLPDEEACSCLSLGRPGGVGVLRAGGYSKCRA